MSDVVNGVSFKVMMLHANVASLSVSNSLVRHTPVMQISRLIPYQVELNKESVVQNLNRRWGERYRVTCTPQPRHRL